MTCLAQDMISSQKPWIVFRGATFRTSAEAQEVALCSIRRHVVAPLKRACALNSVHVHLCVRPHGANRLLVESADKYFGIASGDVSLRELSKAEQPLQQGQYWACLADVPNDAGFALILRPDLVFKKSLSFDRVASPDMFYFQWNLFHHCVNREIADQIHLVGGSLILEFKEKWNSEQMGAVKAGQPYWDTFHMMFTWGVEAFGQERVGCLMEYPATNCFYRGRGGFRRWHQYGFCKQRVNPGVLHHGNVTNPLFTYDRLISTDGEALVFPAATLPSGRMLGCAKRSNPDSESDYQVLGGVLRRVVPPWLPSAAATGLMQLLGYQKAHMLDYNPEESALGGGKPDASDPSLFVKASGVLVRDEVNSPSGSGQKAVLTDALDALATYDRFWDELLDLLRKPLKLGTLKDSVLEVEPRPQLRPEATPRDARVRAEAPPRR
ncbi:unnamed protein product [Prorocentrum cordatum]|uniref:Uncharacterized protein n=1 Tax=Prorocentrum cordatum TaxID=2364126 RepID=A0ABN9XUF9_9DINO|nr:unnamed protein product [Polarella glacialis]